MKKFFLFLVVLLISVNVFCQTQQFFWDESEAITVVNSQFPKVVCNDNQAILFFEEIDEKSNEIWICSQEKIPDSYRWSETKRLAGPFKFWGNVPDIYYACINDDGTVLFSVLSDDNEVSVYTKKSSDFDFKNYKIRYPKNEIVGPRVFSLSNGGFVLFVTENVRTTIKNSENESYEKFSTQILSSTSTDGYSWTEFSEVKAFSNLVNPSLPYLLSFNGESIIVVQSQFTSADGETVTRQLYTSHSSDDLKKLSTPLLISDHEILLKSDKDDFYYYQNQRPLLYKDDNSIYITWEKSPLAVNTSDIMFAQLNSDGDVVKNSVKKLNTSVSANAHRCHLFSINKNLCAVWFDDRNGSDDVYMALKKGVVWNEMQLTSSAMDAQFVFPVVEKAGTELSLIYQQKKSHNGYPVIYTLQKDHTVQVPSIKAVSFKSGRKSTASKYSAKVTLPYDKNGIAGFSYILTQNLEDEPDEIIMNYRDNLNITGQSLTDGKWYFKVKVCDNVMNWSESAVVSFIRDTTPPDKPVIDPLALDKYGFLKSNDLNVKWKQNPLDNDVSGFSWALNGICPIEKNLNDTPRHPIRMSSSLINKSVNSLLARNKNRIAKSGKTPLRNMGKVTSAFYDNLINGLYVFSVCAVDDAGNISQPACVTLLLNKYRAETLIAAVSSVVDDFGTMDISVIGKGFTYDGTVSEIYLDRDCIEPYDVVLHIKDNDYDVKSDEFIKGISVADLEEGLYHVGLLHTDRGIYFGKSTVDVKEYGNVKKFSRYEYEGQWTVSLHNKRYEINVSVIMIFVLCALFLSGAFAASLALSKAVVESVAVSKDVKLLLEGKSNMSSIKNRAKAVALTHKGLGLRVKLVFFTGMLVLMIVLLVSLPLGYLMSRTQEKTLSQGLLQRVNVLMQSVSSSVKIYLPAENDTEISSLPNQTDAFDDIIYATITALPRSSQNTNFDYIWATNDKNIKSKIDSNDYLQGKTRLTGDNIAEINGRFEPLISEINDKVSDLNDQVNMLIAQAMAEPASDMESLKALDDERKVIQSRINKELEMLSDKNTVSYPVFDELNLDRSCTEYTFYKPVFYKQQSTKNYACAVVLMNVSTKNLIETVDAERKRIVFVALLVAIVAVVIGSIGSLIVSTVIVRPVTRLVTHVSKISETKNKEKLSGHEIEVTSNDEIGLLCETVNDMTRGLVKAAMDEKLLMDGKVVQQTFLPLSSVKGGKATTSVINDGTLKFYGYYEGASGVSGDYFDYKKLENPWYVVIKCDASGHGVPAALIMTVVATLFRKYFENWTFKSKGTKLDVLVRQINDFIESLGLKGKFATLLVALVNSDTGDVYMCNAGDNIVHYYDSLKMKFLTLTLMQTPAAGPLPSDLVDMKGGFGVEKFVLKKNDILFLYTDGIEEATRKVRDKNFMQVEGHVELFETDRIKDIIECVFSKAKYVLNKLDDPIDEQLVFDFSHCEGTIEEAITALISVEKVFRFVKDNECSENDTVVVDRKIDAFLKKYFSGYAYYCSETVDEGSENYINYRYLKEDEQLDDLTLVALRRI